MLRLLQKCPLRHLALVLASVASCSPPGPLRLFPVSLMPPSALLALYQRKIFRQDYLETV